MSKYCVVSAPVDTRSGYGARSRDFVRALISAKPDWDIRILSQRWGSTPFGTLEKGKDDDLLSRIIQSGQLGQKPDVWIQISVSNEFQPIGHYNIGVTAGVETTVYPPELLEGVNRMDKVIVSSNFTKELIEGMKYDKKDKQSGQVIGSLTANKKIDVLFEGIDIDVYDNKAPKEDRIEEVMSNVKEDFAFLFVGHWLKGDFRQDRKNVSGLIWTFYETFKNKKNPPALILKTNRGGTSLMDRIDIKKKIEQVKQSIPAQSLPNIYLIHSNLTDAEMNALYNHSKVKAHVSFTRGEGFGRPLLEATISGKPIITSNWSGHVDFLNKDFVTLVDGKLENVHETAADQFLVKEGQWFTIDYGRASAYMKDVHKNYKDYLEKARKHRHYTKQNFTYNHMIDRLNEVIPNSAGDGAPKSQQLQLPKLKKAGGLPKLKKAEPAQSIKLPKLSKPEELAQPTIKLPKLSKTE